MSQINLVEKPRIKTLDSLRGLAALTVVFTHIAGVSANEKIIHLTPLYILKSGHEAVIFFFLLSGYVLVYQYAANPDYTYGEFLLQRICRIYVPYIVAMLFTVILFLLCKPHHLGTAWVHSMWTTPLSFNVIAKHVILVGNFGTSSFDPVIWSLVHEMRIAIIFPLLLLILKCKPINVLAISLTVAIIALIGIALNFEQAFGYYNTYSFTAYYLYIFIVGGLIAKKRTVLIARYKRLTTNRKVLFLIIAILMYNYANLGIYIFSITKHAPIVNDTIFMAVGDFLTVVASCYFIIASVSVSNNNVLTNRLFTFFGKISYSLYLVHLPVLSFLYFTLYNKIPTAVILSLGFVASLIVAAIFNKCVEQPSVRIFKKGFFSKFYSRKTSSFRNH